MRSVVLASLAGAALVTMAVLVLAAGQGSDRSARADSALVVGFDMDPTGNSCPGDGVTDCTLGTIDTCVQVPSGGGTIEFDIYLDGLPAGETLSAWRVVIGERNNLPPGQVTAITNTNPAINLIAQMPGSGPYLDVSETGALPGLARGDIADLGNLETNPPFTKGVLGRFTADITGPDGVYGLTVNSPLIINSSSVSLCDTEYYEPGCQVMDAQSGYGLIAVGVDCSAGPPVLTPTPTPTPAGPAPTATPTPTPTPAPATPTPVPPDLAAGWNYACYLGAALPISEALADIMPSVLAIYHLRPDQGYDKWFPGRPELSTITDLNSYEPLFILMANDSAWTQSPADAPPTGLDLTQGWNSACYSGQTKDVSSATASIAGQYEALYLLPAGQSWKRFMPARPEISNLDQLQQFAAVLILVTQSEGAHWIFDS